ncbi:helix-turn-helix transcriptional regulator [Ruania zhangjianzhongii]|uniref:helix-turn-helix transcriptional regulator n=1 Tax=Ruania zhangjianzhongii TaxID=2603206 RepID=UPI0011C9A464|nr:helix-turn-helix transcriptional regulator [Ruania zhangjianzhongii]
MASTRTELGEFLRSRRERLTPERAGLPAGLTIRRVPGLRREELAQLAGVSAGYYTRLEQGVSHGASPAVIDALATALQLDEAEHQHLRTLATPRRPIRHRPRRHVLRPAVRDLLDALDLVAAVVIDHRTEVIGWNRLGHAMLASHLDWEAPETRSRPNIARMLFLDPHHRALYRDWRGKALATVAALHQQTPRHPGDIGLERLVGELTVASGEFALMWSQRPVRTCASSLRELDHPVVGRMTLTNETLSLPDDDQQLGLFHARPGTPDQEALTLLAALEHPTTTPPSAAVEAQAHR